MRKFLSSLFALAAIQLSAQSDTCFDPNSKAYYKCNRTEAKICVEYLINDLEELQDKLLTVHPDPYAYCGKMKFDSAYSKAFSYYTEERTMIEHAQNLNRFSRIVSDSHLQTHVFSLTSEASYFDTGFLPLFILAINDKFYIEKDYVGGPPVGSEIISIGKLSMSELHELAKEWCVDEGEATKSSQEAANYYYTSAHFFANPNQLSGDLETIRYTYNNELDSVIIELLDFQEIRKIRKQYFNLSKKNIESSFFRTERKAVLKLNSFSPAIFQNDRKKIRKFFQTTKEMGINDIAIDVRNNPGGSSSMVEFLCSFLTTEGINTPSNIIWKASEYSYPLISHFRMKHFPKSTEKKFKRNEDLYQYFILYNTSIEESDTAYFTIPQRQRISDIYLGNITLFMNGNTASAACDFSQLMLNNKRATLIGTPCNATINGTWGNPVTFQLNESGITISIPTIRYNYNNTFSYSIEPILPNITLITTPEDLKEGKDTFLEYFLNN